MEQEANSVLSENEKIPSQKLEPLIGKTEKIVIGAVILFFVSVSTLGIILGKVVKPPVLQQKPDSQDQQLSFEKFTSQEEFENYLKEAESVSIDLQEGIGGSTALRSRWGLALESAQPGLAPLSAPNRVSQTNVQVAGIDEPDIVKTDGNNIFYSFESFDVIPLAEPDIEQGTKSISSPPTQQANTLTLTAFPPQALSKISEIDKSGQLLLVNNSLIIISTDKIYGYNVTDPKSPSESWSMDLESNDQIVDSRLYQDKVYIVLRKLVNKESPCPLTPITIRGQSPLTVPCTDIYHPTKPIPTDSVYTIVKINPVSGNVEDTITFTGSTGSTVVYMSTENIFITYSYFEDMIDFVYQFIFQEGQDLLPEATIQRINNLRSLDISQQAKFVEFGTIIAGHLNNLSDDERERISNELTNRMEAYTAEHVRDLEKTGIIRVDRAQMKLQASGTVPGQPLNQYSLDEYGNNLRIATTASPAFFSSDSVNDVYILDSALTQIGSIKDLGIDEQIYSARFIGNRGYLVTFRQIDPFYVLDLSDPRNPQVAGELKIPGFSSYLHPLRDTIVLGVGRENGQVKASLFDVSNPQNPQEISKYVLNDYTSEVLDNARAFLQDPKFEVFFLPGGQGGYIFSYVGNKLSLERVVTGFQVQRAVFIDNYLYILGQEEVTVLNESDWSEVNSLEL